MENNGLDNIPGIGRTSFTIRFDAKSWMSNDIFGKDIPTQIKIVGMYRPTWWEKFKSWFGYEYPLYVAERVEPRDLIWIEKQQIKFTNQWKKDYEDLILYPKTPSDPDYGKIKLDSNRDDSSFLGEKVQATYLGKVTNLGLCNMISDINYFVKGDKIQTEEQVITILSKPQMWSDSNYSGWLYEIDENIHNISVGDKMVRLI